MCLASERLDDETDRLPKLKRDEEDQFPQIQNACDRTRSAHRIGTSDIQPDAEMIVTENGYQNARGVSRDENMGYRPLGEAN